ncbi:hypothetical protein AVBRAN9333_05685, partial [Campylobacter sp. RM9333]|uniref:hypothetical protein n=1 Tax=Campylobacter sp. RM9333 TaxID=2735731 RepID=UPI001D8C1AB6|nr:hypothetical protein [Campylobacter sp. RM9333]
MLGGGILKLSLAASALIFSQGLIADEPQTSNQNTPIVKQNEANSQGINSSPSNPTGTPTAENGQDSKASNQGGEKQPELDNQGGEKQPAEDNKDSEKQPELDNQGGEKQPAEDNKDSEKQPAEDNKDSGK